MSKTVKKQALTLRRILKKSTQEQTVRKEVNIACEVQYWAHDEDGGSTVLQRARLATSNKQWASGATRQHARALWRVFQVFVQSAKTCILKALVVASKEASRCRGGTAGPSFHLNSAITGKPICGSARVPASQISPR